MKYTPQHPQVTLLQKIICKNELSKYCTFMNIINNYNSIIPSVWIEVLHGMHNSLPRKTLVKRYLKT